MRPCRRLGFEADSRTGDYVLWADTAASLRRLALGLGISTLLGVCFGLALGLLPVVSAAFAPLVAVMSMVPPMAILPVLFIVFGLGELSSRPHRHRIAPFLVRDLALAVRALPAEQLVKAQTLGASTWQIAIRVVLPQVMPRVVDAVRLSLGPAFLFPDFGGGDRFRCRARLPHFSGAALSGDGCDPALRGLDHALSYLLGLCGCSRSSGGPDPGKVPFSGRLSEGAGR